MQLDAAQLAEYRQLKAQADDKTGRLLQEKAALEAQLKVGGLKKHECGHRKLRHPQEGWARGTQSS